MVSRYSPLHVALALVALGMTALDTSDVHADFTLNAPMPITRQLTVQPIVARRDDGTAPATFLGSASQEAIIKGFVDDIWEQAGIDIAWNSVSFLDSTETLNGSDTNYTVTERPENDLSGDPGGMDHETLGASLRQMNAINMFFVDVAAGFTVLGDNTVAGLAETPGDDISMYIGVNLPGFNAGREAVASVIAHEIGHNLGLPHPDEQAGGSALFENLMNSATAANENAMYDGERLTSAQITTAINTGTSNNLFVAVPEPGAFLLVGLIGCLQLVWRTIPA